MTGKKRTAGSAYSAPIVSKAMRVLQTIVASSENQGISEIASRLSLAKSTTHGILTALEESGWVLRDPITRKYTCGHVFKELAADAQVRLPLVSMARPYLEELGSSLNEDVFLGVMAAGRILVLDQIESLRDLKVSKRPGTTISMLAGAVGKIFLAHQDRDCVRDMLNARPMPRFTPISILDPEKYMLELDKAFKDGVAHDLGEYIHNVWAVASPILHGAKNRKRMVAGFWVVGLDPERSMEKIALTRRRAVATGKALSKALNGGSTQE